MAIITGSDVLSDPFASAYRQVSETAYVGLKALEHTAYKPRRILKFASMSSGTSDTTGAIFTRGYRAVRLLHDALSGTPTWTLQGASDGVGSVLATLVAATGRVRLPAGNSGNESYGYVIDPPDIIKLTITAGGADLYVELIP